ncbi:MAG: tetratricopeptide repeat protein, partial [Myxococcota bacterium]|nr:tetratricopeptide repeat protein [Myxococcota bacterium]
WFHNESARLRSKVLGQGPANSTAAVVSPEMPSEEEQESGIRAPLAEPMPLKSADVYRAKAKGARALQDWELAVHMARQGVKATGRRDGELLTLLADSLVPVGGLDEAVGLLQEADRLVTREVTGHLRAADLLIGVDRCGDAVPILESARERGGPDLDLALKLGRCLAELGRSQRAVIELERAVTRPNPDPDALSLLGEHLETLGRTREAIGAYERTLRWSPGHPTASPSLARLRAADGDLDGVNQWVKAGARGVSDTDKRALVAHASFQAGRFDEAVDAYEALVAEGSEPSPAVLRNHAIALERSGKLRRAMRAYERAIEASGEDAELHLALGHLLRSDGRARRSVGHLTRGLALTPDSRAGRFELGLAQLDLRDYEKAAAAFSAVLKTSPGDLDALKNLGAAQVGMGAMPAALATYRALGASRPGDGAIQLTIGVVLTRMGRSEEAALALRRACSLGAEEACQ